jgi:hypothetical protein
MRNKSTKKRMRNKSKKMRGGYGKAVGSPWNGGDVAHSSNFLPLSPNGITAGFFKSPPIPSNPQFIGGGGRRRKNIYKKKQRGGSIATKIFPQDLVNLGRSLTGGINGIYNKFQGVPRADSTYPLPFEQPNMLRGQTNNVNSSININKITTNSVNSVLS